jgi:hypothetical protein
MSVPPPDKWFPGTAAATGSYLDKPDFSTKGEADSHLRMFSFAV